MAVLRDLGLEKYIAKDAKPPGSANPQSPTTEELAATKKWAEGDAKVQTRIELAIGHGAMSGTNFKMNQKSKTPYLVHYKLYHLKE